MTARREAERIVGEVVYRGAGGCDGVDGVLLAADIREALEAAWRDGRDAGRQECESVLSDMRVDSAAYLRGVAEALALVARPLPRAHDGRGADIADLARQLLCDHAQSLQTQLDLTVRPRSELTLEVGTFGVRMGDTPMSGRTTLDGRPVPVRGFSIDWTLGEMPEVSLRVVPLALSAVKAEAVCDDP